MGIKVFDGSSSTPYSPPSQTGNSGKFLTTNGTTTSWSPTGITLLGSVTAAGSSVSFSGIDQSYRHLQVVSRGVNTSASEIGAIRVNGKTGESYYPYSETTGAGWNQGTSSYGARYIYTNESYFTYGVVNIYDYADTTNGAKVWKAQSGFKSSTGLYNSYGTFNSTSTNGDGIGPITSISLTTTNTFTAGTFLLYGVK
jgi:hypothetical protein